MTTYRVLVEIQICQSPKRKTVRHTQQFTIIYSQLRLMNRTCKMPCPAQSHFIKWKNKGVHERNLLKKLWKSSIIYPLIKDIDNKKLYSKQCRLLTLYRSSFLKSKLNLKRDKVRIGGRRLNLAPYNRNSSESHRNKYSIPHSIRVLFIFWSSIIVWMPT